jgi:hypothetical protein
MIVFAADFVRMIPFPSKREAVPLVHANAVAATPIALECLEAVSRRALEVRKALRHVEHLELPPDDWPNILWNLSSRLCRSLTEQIRRPFIRERLDHFLAQ